jgi:type 1 glutamine amidotransferase
VSVSFDEILVCDVALSAGADTKEDLMKVNKLRWLCICSVLIFAPFILRAQQTPGTQAASQPRQQATAPDQGYRRNKLTLPPELRVELPSSIGFVVDPSYDETSPKLPADLKPGAVLIFSKTNGFRDEPAVQASDAALAAIAQTRGFPFFVTENGAVMNPDQLSKFKLVIWNNTSGDTLNEEQKRAFQAWLEKGGTSFGIHGAGGDPDAKGESGLVAKLFANKGSAAVWKWYIDSVVGVQFIGHSFIQPADVHIEDKTSPLTKGLPAVWHRTDEWYSFSENPRKKPGFHVIAVVDEKSYQTQSPSVAGALESRSLSMGDDHPSIWWHCVGSGRALYSAEGHGAEMYQEPLMLQFLSNAMSWGLSESGHACPK